MSVSRIGRLYEDLYTKRLSGVYDVAKPLTYTWQTLPDTLERHLTVPRFLFTHEDIVIPQFVSFRWPHQGPIAEITLIRTVQSTTHEWAMFGSLVKYMIGPGETDDPSETEAIKMHRASFVRYEADALPYLTNETNAAQIDTLAENLQVLEQPEIDHFREPTALAMVLRHAKPSAPTV